ncbi:unnamed protein product [Boreogadus saida]
MFGCEWDDEDGTTGNEQYGYDGEDFISFDLETLTWVAAVPQACSTKQRWDGARNWNEQKKYFLTKEFFHLLKELLVYGKSTLQRTERPRVSLLQRSPSSPVVCHATGFYPDRVVVFWRRDGQKLHEQVDPGEVLPNHDGTFQVSVDLNLKAVPQEDWGRYECVVQLKGIEDISTPLDPALIRTNWVSKSGLTIPIIIGLLVLLLAAAAAVVGVLLYKKRNGSDTSSENTEGQNPAPEAQPLTTTGLSLVIRLLFAGFLVSASDARVGVTSLWIISSSCSSEYIDMKALIGLLLLVFGHGVSSVLHSLHYFYTGSSGLSTFPEFVVVGMVDGVQMVHYDSNSKRAVPKQDWMERYTRDNPDYLERSTGIFQGEQQTFKASIGNVKKRFNQTGGIHMVQYMYGCEWDDDDDTTDGYRQYGYDGEDFISLDLKTLTWVAPVRQAVPTKQKWDQNRAELQYIKHYQTMECVDWLKKYLDYGKSTLQRTERPRVSLLQRSPSSPVVCHATGFYPDRVVVFWRRDGQELHEQVDPGEVLPNHDGTFQVSVDLNLKAVPQEDWGRYECVVQLRGIEDISTPLDPALIRTNWGQSGLTIPIIIGLLVLLLAAAAAVVGVLLYKKRNASDKRHKPVGSYTSSDTSSDPSSENTEGQNPAPEAQPLTTG